MEAPMLLADLWKRSSARVKNELKWGLDQKLSWGEIVTLAYIQATTGKSFAAMNQEDEHVVNFWAYAEDVGMNCEKMAHWLEGFQSERNANGTLVSSTDCEHPEKYTALPDLGSGFGLLQEALDFRRIDSRGRPRFTMALANLQKGEMRTACFSL
jgi:hypothetical protein